MKIPAKESDEKWKEILNAPFELGRVTITANADSALNKPDVDAAIERHKAGDWGDVSKDDWQQNNEFAKEKEMLLSVYYDSKGTKFWIITDAGHATTTVLLPSDY